MRVLAQPRTPLERQVWESVNIDRLSITPEACLNLKSEWGQSQTPYLQPKPNKPGKRTEEEKNQSKRAAKDLRKGEPQETAPPGKKQRLETQEIDEIEEGDGQET